MAATNTWLSESLQVRLQARALGKVIRHLCFAVLTYTYGLTIHLCHHPAVHATRSNMSPNSGTNYP